MTCRTFVACAVAAIGLACASTAHAELINLTFTGTLGLSPEVTVYPYEGEIDTYGLFGSAGANVTGDTYSLSVILDTSQGQIDSGPGFSEIWDTSTSDFVQSATVTINGHTVSNNADGNVNSYVVWAAPTPGEIGFQFQLGSLGTYTPWVSQFSVTEDTFVLTDAPFTINSSFSPMNLVSGSGVIQVDGDFFYVYPHTIEATVASDVPEPSVWALNLAGFIMVGGLLRSGRKGSLVLSQKDLV